MIVSVYGAVLIVVSLLAHVAAPGGVSTALIAGLAGGAVCLLLGILGMMGWRYRAWTILTLVAICYVLLSQVVIGWLGGERGESRGGLAPVLLTMLLILSVGLVAYLAQAWSQAKDSSTGMKPR